MAEAAATAATPLLIDLDSACELVLPLPFCNLVFAPEKVGNGNGLRVATAGEEDFAGGKDEFEGSARSKKNEPLSFKGSGCFDFFVLCDEGVLGVPGELFGV